MANWRLSTRALFPGPLVLLVLIPLASACQPQQAAAPAAWQLDESGVAGPREGEAQSVAVDLYLDGTASMAGYVADGSGRYGEFVKALESSVRTGWRSSDLRFFKFGTAVRPLPREEVFPAAFTPGFFSERGIFEKTHIDSVVDRTSRDRLSVVVTDLFQDEGDVNELVMHIKERGFSRGVEVALLGVRSPFDGQVFDAGVTPYRYRSVAGQPATYRPFYALVFGDRANLRRLYETLSPAIEPRYFTLISPYVLRASRVRVERAPPARGKPPPLNGLGEGAAGEFSFQFVRGESRGALDARVAFERDPSAPDFAVERVRLTAQRKRLGPRGAWVDSAATDDLALETLRRRGDTLTARLRADLSRLPPGTYAYRVTLDAGGIGGMSTPEWVRELSTLRPGPEADANKTLNLEKFVADMIQASGTVNPPKLASFVLTFRKQ
jgi:hypothetical protein